MKFDQEFDPVGNVFNFTVENDCGHRVEVQSRGFLQLKSLGVYSVSSLNIPFMFEGSLQFRIL